MKFKMVERDEHIVQKMRAAAGKFRGEALNTEDVPTANILTKVADDYDMCADYIERLEEQLAGYQLQSIRAAGALNS